MPEDTRKSRSRVVSMFDLVPRDATEGTDQAKKLCLRAAGGCVTSALPHGSQLQAAGPFSLEALLGTDQVFLITGRLDYVSLPSSLDCGLCASPWCWFILFTVYFSGYCDAVGRAAYSCCGRASF